ncbi:hypothetical protein IB234_11485 [Pseudomonas sp. PDM16]|uniref:hypothetical protein n=1 Tax=Pseudomonas sp. PDM16 TaxID=2769292 RepID=UPI0017840C2B|nr:hypothetical protein [Pseudomonas sp. PDM16]MBD9415178.1 hypothetical protein [Pseudomonas sp. PDM16]
MSVSIGHRALLLALMASGAPLAQAEYLWIERGAETSARAVLSDFQPTEKLSLAALTEPQQRLADGGWQPLQASGDAYVLNGAVGDLRMQAKHADGKALTLYEAREGRGETTAKNDLELVPTTPNGNVFQLHWKGKVVSASQVNVHTSEQWSKVLKPAADGSVMLDTPFPGHYVLEVAAQINGSATVDGKSYDSVTHVATLSFEVK